MTPYYDEGGVTIYNADCADVLPSIDPDDVALVLTDPPYGIGLSADYERQYGREEKLSARRISHADVAGDDAPFDPSGLFRFPRVVTFGANYYREDLPADGGWIVWDKVCRNEVKRLPSWSDGELAWTNAFRGVKIYRHAWNGFSRSSENSFHVHPTQKPVSLMRWIVDRWTEPGDLILDPYMGSGPVAQACADLGRRYIGVELVEDYCRVAVERLSQQSLDLSGGAA